MDHDAASEAHIVAFDLGGHQPLRGANRSVEWIRQTPSHFARLCLPLVVACEAGWWLCTREQVQAQWNGGDSPSDLTVVGPATSHFGSGVVTFHVEYLFRTPPDVQLLVKGPSNRPKDGVAPLEGIVESDWTAATFTMNWKFTRPGSVTWAPDEPFCQVMPIRLRDFDAPLEVRPIESDAALMEQYNKWRERREATIREGNARELDYVRGRTHLDDEPAASSSHRTRVTSEVFQR